MTLSINMIGNFTRGEGGRREEKEGIKEATVRLQRELDARTQAVIRGACGSASAGLLRYI